jgi:signal transduction histidine kinase
MRFRTWPVAALGLAGLLALVIVSSLASARRAQEIYSQLDRLNTHHRDVETKLRNLRSDVNLSAIYVRDFLIENERAAEYRQRLADLRRTNLATFQEFKALSRTEDAERVARLGTQLEDYWEAYQPLFEWSPGDRTHKSAEFLREQTIPRRQAVLAIAQEIEELNNSILLEQRNDVTARQADFRATSYRVLWQSTLLGLLVALTAVTRLRVLEGRSEAQRQLAEEAERQLRHLSQQIVAAQESERKTLSRELHDHVGQMLTALRMELGRIERARAPGEHIIAQRVTECRQLVDNMVRTVRDLALGLRPSMLDDLGLQPALEWHVRDVARRFGVEADLDVHGNFDGLPEQWRTCIYRSVQEALTNCVRHAFASRITVGLAWEDGTLHLRVRDNGVGLNHSQRREGLGLRGLEERVKELNGTMAIESSPGAGTTVDIRLPRAGAFPEDALARVAG